MIWGTLNTTAVHPVLYSLTHARCI